MMDDPHDSPTEKISQKVDLFIPQELNIFHNTVFHGYIYNEYQHTFENINEGTLCIQAVRLILKQSHTIVLHCVSDNMHFCFKLKHSWDDIQKEIQIYSNLVNTNASHLFPKIYGVIVFDISENTKWGAICMDLYDISAVHVINDFCCSKHKDKVNLLRQKYEALTQNTKETNDTSRGVNIQYVGDNMLKSSIVSCCMQLLNGLHSYGWIHGDSHLGNFLIDIENMRIILIDVERAFQSRDPTLRLLDIQETFGHACTITVSMPYASSWDFTDMMGVASILHPFHSLTKSQYNTTKHWKSYNLSDQYIEIKRTSKSDIASTISELCLFLMLPVCSCFSHYKTLERERGCILCKSILNSKTAFFLCSDQKNLIQVLIPLINRINFSKLQSTVMMTRDFTRKHATDVQKILKYDKILKKKLQETIPKNEIYAVFDTQDQKRINLDFLYAKYILFMPIFSPSVKIQVQCFLKANQCHDLLEYIPFMTRDHGKKECLWNDIRCHITFTEHPQ